MEYSVRVEINVVGLVLLVAGAGALLWVLLPDRKDEHSE